MQIQVADFVTIGRLVILEGLLSADNALVIARAELVNLAFSIDSILVAVAVSPKLWVVLSGGILGIVAMRLVVGQLLVLIEQYPPLVDGAFVIIAWVGVKLLIEYLHEAHSVRFDVPRWASTIIAWIFVVSFVYARTQGALPSNRVAEQAGDRLDQ